jgi:predicted phosphatase
MDMLVRAFGGPERISLVNSTLSALRGAGAALAICSFNSKKVIIKTLGAERIGLLRHFDVAHVHGFESFHCLPPRSSYGDLYHKGHLIRELFLGRGLAPSRLCFVDDQHSNLRAVSTVAPGCRLVRSCPSRGIGSAECETILSWARGVGLQEQGMASRRSSFPQAQAGGGLDPALAARTLEAGRLPV